jgi:hypothetical protein
MTRHGEISEAEIAFRDAKARSIRRSSQQYKSINEWQQHHQQQRQAILLLQRFFFADVPSNRLPIPVAAAKGDAAAAEGGTTNNTPLPQQQTTQASSMSSKNNWNKIPIMKRKIKKPLSPQTVARRLTRKYKSSSSSSSSSSWYHSVAAQNRLGSIQETTFWGDEDHEKMEEEAHKSSLRQAKRNLLQALNQNQGDFDTPAFHRALQALLQHYHPEKPMRRRPAAARPSLEGIGISAGKPSFPGCIGRNQAGDPLFQLGTMSFGTSRIKKWNNFFSSTSAVPSSHKVYASHDLVHSLLVPIPQRHVLPYTAGSKRPRNLCLD